MIYLFIKKNLIIIAILLNSSIILLPAFAITVEEWIKKGDDLIAQGKYEEAIKRYNTALNLDPCNITAWCKKGCTLYSLGMYKEAIDCFDIALKLDPNNYLPIQYKDKVLKTISDLPVFLGESQQQIHIKLGQPDRTNYYLSNAYETFFNYGLVIQYNSDKTINNILVTHLISGPLFKGKIFGISLGDSVEQCLSLWGNSEKIDSTPYLYSKIRWHYKGYQIEVEAWDENGTDKNFGTYKKGFIKSIKISN